MTGGVPWRIVFLSHDVKKAIGGVRTLYAHATALRRAGFDAVVAQGDTTYRPDWFPADVPVVAIDALATLGPADAVVLPEDLGSLPDRSRIGAARPVVFCQNHFYAVAALGEAGDWVRAGIRVVCGGTAIRDFLAAHYGWRDLPVIPYAIDPMLFRPRAKEPTVVFMPRKRPVEATLIRTLFRRKFPHHADIAIVPIEGQSEQRTAELLGRAAVFLSLSRLEGFGLPPVEAMAAEAVVVGFHGEGGREYATTDNGVWVADGAIAACVSALGELCDRLKADDPSIRAMRAAGRRTAAAYSPAARDAALLAFWRSMAPPAS